MPLIWGMFVRRAPSWAGWTTVLIGLATSYLTQKFLTPRGSGGVLGVHVQQARGQRLGAGDRHRDEHRRRLGVVPAHAVDRRRAPPRREPSAERVDQFFAEMRTPVDFEREEGPGSDNLQAKVMGMLCLIYGGFITLLALIPNPLIGRLAFVFCGAVMFGVGWMLHRASKFKESRAEAAARGIVASPTVSDQP